MQNTCLSKIRPSVPAFLTGGRLFVWTLLCLFGILAGERAGVSSAHATPKDAFDAPGNFNPIVPGYFADPTIRKFGDLYYLYATTDGNGGGRGPSQVWVSKDFVNWTLVPMNWPKTPVYWAPDVLKHTDGRYYLYYNQPCVTFCGVSDSPIGPWTPLVGEDGLLIEDKKVPNVITLDTQSFVDKDGSIYLYWGTWGIYPNSGCGVGKLNPDMKTFAKLGKIPNTQAKDFFEAPFMLERNGLYYFTYSSGSCHDGTYRVQYAVGDRPDGDFKMGPNNPILVSNADDTVNGPGHHSILKENKDDYFIVYHRHDIPLTPNGMHRQVCADKMAFGAEGEILKVEPTHRGIGYLGNPPKRSPNLTTGKPVRASSHYRDTVRNHVYKPEYAVDDNNATLWRPNGNHMGPDLTVDLLTPQRIRRTETQFEYATWYYQYLIEYSIDGKEWKVFADRRNNLRWGSPMVDKGDVEACYLRITVTGTEYPGLTGAIWNFKAFSDAPDDPLEEMAARAFEQVVGAEREKKKSDAEYLAQTDHSCNPLISLDVSDLQLGDTVSSWKNKGTLGGEFGAVEAKPRVELAGGCKALRFSGNQILKASFTGPRVLSGNNSFTVSAWVLNPEIGESECIVSWAGRGGPDAATAQIGYGTHREFGVVGHWGFADMGFRQAPPKAGEWHHIAVVFDGVVERVYVDGKLDSAEAKMLMMHAGRPVYVGASEPGSEYLDGYLASLRIYDHAMYEKQIQKLAADTPQADVLVHADSAKLDYGPLSEWRNQGAWGGAFSGKEGSIPKVENVGGRIAVRFHENDCLSLSSRSSSTLSGGRTLLASVWISDEKAVEPVSRILSVGDGNQVLGVTPRNFSGLVAGKWNQIAVVLEGETWRAFLNGVPLSEPQKSSFPVGSLNTLTLGKAGDVPGLNGALAQIQLFRRALPEGELAQLYEVWKREWRAPQPSPATFSTPPRAISSTAISMAAQPAQSEAGTVEYRFVETTGQSKADSGWIATPFFFDPGLKPDTRYVYTVTVRDSLGNVTASGEPVEAKTDQDLIEEYRDTFQTSHDYLKQGVEGTIWEGILATGENAAEAVTSGDGQVRLQSKGTVWDGGRPHGPLLYRMVQGDFLVEVKVADYAGLEQRRTPGNTDGGLMVRVPNLADAGEGEDLIQLSFFPIWNIGNMVTNFDGGSRSQKGNQLAWNAHRYLQIERQGDYFHMRTSADGKRWVEMPESPVLRRDMAGLPVAVGLCHASYGPESSYISFSDFRLSLRKDRGKK
jgi:hypothetical protein